MKKCQLILFIANYHLEGLFKIGIDLYYAKAMVIYFIPLQYSTIKENCDEIVLVSIFLAHRRLSTLRSNKSIHAFTLPLYEFMIWCKLVLRSHDKFWFLWSCGEM